MGLLPAGPLPHHTQLHRGERKGRERDGERESGFEMKKNREMDTEKKREREEGTRERVGSRWGERELTTDGERRKRGTKWE